MICQQVIGYLLLDLLLLLWLLVIAVGGTLAQVLTRYVLVRRDEGPLTAGLRRLNLPLHRCYASFGHDLLMLMLMLFYDFCGCGFVGG